MIYVGTMLGGIIGGLLFGPFNSFIGIGLFAAAMNLTSLLIYFRSGLWVIQQELQTHNKGLLKTGTKIKLNASHMLGMMGAEATIDSAKQTNIYMVNYTDTKTGKVVKTING